MDEQQRKLAEELLFSAPKAPSFGKRLYFGELHNEHIFPFPQLSSDEQQQLDKWLADVEAFASSEINGDKIDRQASIPDSVIAGLGKLGILGMTIPTSYGGLGASQHTYCRVIEIISRYCGSTALFVNAHQSIGMKALLLFGTPEQKDKWLPPLARGELLAAFSLTEPNAGSDANGVETKAVFDREKKVWRINGRKQWTTNGAIAGILTVMAKVTVDTRDGPQERVTAFLVTPDMPGFKVLVPALEKVGMRGSKTANLQFIDLEVPAENVLGPIGGGLRVCLTALDYGRVTFGATCTGAARYLVARAYEHAKNRYQFKRPLASFALVKRKLANMSALLYAMESATYLTAGLIDSHVEDVMLESAMLKVFASESLWTILYDTMQIFGGRSFFTDEPFERMMRDARLNMIGEGSNEVLRAFIGVVGMRDLGMQMQAGLFALQHPISQFHLLKEFGRHWLHRTSTPVVPVQSAELQPQGQALGRAIRSFGFAVTKLLVRHREEILEKQLLLDRIANSAMAIYTATAAISRLDSALQQHGANSLQKELATVKFYCSMAFATIRDNLNSLDGNLDDETEALADLLLGVPAR
jgi:alkylation response protein AidB-like acyl-CoA dehydrogenase